MIRRLSLLLALAALTGAPAWSATNTVTGWATDLEDAGESYRELHYCTANGARCSIEYRGQAGELLAEKQLDYSASLQAPAMEMEDYRHDLVLRSNHDPKQPVVVDAGFDNYVRTQWDELEQGLPVRFPLLLAGRDKPIDMVATQREDPQCSEDQLCLRVRIDSWLLSRVVAPIDLDYSRKDRRLQRYRGISNLRDSEGDTRMVEIRYEYVLGLQANQCRGNSTMEAAARDKPVPGSVSQATVRDPDQNPCAQPGQEPG